VGRTGFLVLGAPAGLVIFSRLSGKYNDGSKNKAFSHLGLGIIIVLCFSSYYSLLAGLIYFLTLGLFIYGVGGG